MADPILEVRDLVKIYGDAAKTQVLYGVNVSIPAGRFTAIIGPSGSGKSTFLNLVSLLEKPSSGTIVVNGQDTTRMTGPELASFRNEFEGFIFQFHHLLPEFNAYENILMPTWIAGRDGSPETRQRALELMRRIGILSIKDKYPNEISGGQQQRVAIARALMNRPRLIFADEPTGNLDRETGREVLDLFRQIIHEEGATLVMVTHDREIAMSADYILELVDGRFCRGFSIRDVGEAEARRLLEDRACTPPD